MILAVYTKMLKSAKYVSGNMEGMEKLWSCAEYNGHLILAPVSNCKMGLLWWKSSNIWEQR
jgi:hypothetical protein